MGLPPMPKIQPGCKMRALNWKKLENRKVKDSFWMDKKVVEEVEKVKFDEKKLEAMFEDASASRASMSAGEGSSSVEEKPKGPKTLLDMRRNQNICESSISHVVSPSRLLQGLCMMFLL